jgi:hypothetical protein
VAKILPQKKKKKTLILTPALFHKKWASMYLFLTHVGWHNIVGWPLLFFLKTRYKAECRILRNLSIFHSTRYPLFCPLLC